MTLLEPYQNGHGKGIGVGGIRCAVKLEKPFYSMSVWMKELSTTPKK